jgi:hypothetical protein
LEAGVLSQACSVVWRGPGQLMGNEIQTGRGRDGHAAINSPLTGCCFSASLMPLRYSCLQSCMVSWFCYPKGLLCTTCQKKWKVKVKVTRETLGSGDDATAQLIVSNPAIC